MCSLGARSERNWQFSEYRTGKGEALVLDIVCQLEATSLIKTVFQQAISRHILTMQFVFLSS